MSWEEAEYYKVTNVWVVVKEDGTQDVIIEVQGVRGDGSYWVNGFNVIIPRKDYDKMTESQIDGLITAEIKKNEDSIKKWRQLQQTSDGETKKIKQEEKITKIMEKTYPKPTTQ